MPQNKYYPVVIVPGIGQSKVVETDAAGQPVRTVWPFDPDKDLLIDRMKAPFMKMLFFRRDGGFSDALAQTAAEMLSGLKTLPTGEMQANVKAVTYPYPFSECSESERRHIYKMAPVQTLSNVIGEENVFFFAYNSFAMPYTVAAELHDFVAMVKARTGSEKVSFMPLSLGGAMFTAYLDAYGAADVHRVVYFVPALWGTVTIGDLFAKRVNVKKADSLMEPLLGAGAAESLGRLSGLMPEGVMDAVAEKLFGVLLSEVLLNSGAMWACLPPADYDALAARYLADDAHAAFRAQTDRYRAAQAALPQTLRKMRENGVNVYIIACYGRSSIAALESAGKVSTDGLIDVWSASLGANAAPLGQTLPAGEGKDAAYLSPDGALDASTGAFPESTWYFHGQYHDSIAYNDTALEIARRALSEEDFVFVRSVPALGQFHEKQDNRNG